MGNPGSSPCEFSGSLMGWFSKKIYRSALDIHVLKIGREPERRIYTHERSNVNRHTRNSSTPYASTTRADPRPGLSARAIIQACTKLFIGALPRCQYGDWRGQKYSIQNILKNRETLH